MINFNKLNKNKFSILNFVIDIFVFAYILSVFLFSYSAELVVYSNIIYISVCLLITLYIILKGDVLANYLWLILLFFLMICMVSAIFAYEVDAALNICKIILRALIIVFFLSNYCVKENKTKLLIFSLTVSGIIFSCYVILYYGVVEYFQKMLSGERIGGEITNVNTIGLASSYTFVFLFWFILFEKKYFCIIPSAVCFITAFGSGSKKAFLVILLGVTLLFLFRGKIKKRLLNILEFIIVLVVLYFVLKQPMFEMISVRLDKMVKGLIGNGKTDLSTIERLNFIIYGFDAFIESPFWGVGVGNTFLIAFMAAGRRTYLHNNYIELLVSVGLVGTVLYYLMFLIPLVILARNVFRKQDKYIILGFCFLVTVLTMDFALVSYYDKFTYLYLLLFAVMSKNIYENNNDFTRRTKLCTK